MKSYSNLTYRMLRNTRLLQEGELDGVRFIRCIPPTNAGEQRSPVEKLALVQAAVREINDPGVALANNPDFGGDYLRVNVGCPTYGLIGQMLS